MGIERPRAESLQVAAVIREAIRSGEWPPGFVLPSEPELAARYGVTRATVNRALSVLRTEGLVRPERGRGTTVNELPVIRRQAVTRQHRDVREAGQARGAFDGELRSLGLVPRSEVEVARVPAPAAIADMLGLDEGVLILARRRCMYADDTPVQLATSYLPLDIAEGTALASTDPGPGGIYSRLADLGYAPATYTETARVRPPDEEETQFLRMDPDQRVIGIWRTARTAAGRIVEVNEITLPAHQWELVYEWTAQ
jgi:GntR family transcriptional regulator